MIQFLFRLMVELTNGRITSSLLRKFAQSRISRLFVPSFVKVYKINLSELEKSLAEYANLHELFIRKLKTGVRPFENSPESIISPIDGIIEDFGVISETKEMTIKGKKYSVEEMLGEKQALSKYLGGTYMILYLSPSHYHRIHSPVSGRIVAQWTLGNKSYPVNKWGLKYGRQPLSKNYRKITEIKHNDGHLAVVKVGAMFVNSIEIIYEGNDISKGDELAYFTFGSTVVLLFEKDTFNLLPSINIPTEISVGQKLGEIRK